MLWSLVLFVFLTEILDKPYTRDLSLFELHKGSQIVFYVDFT